MKKSVLILLLWLGGLSATAQPAAHYAAWADTLTRMTGFAPTGGNGVTYTSDGEVFLAEMLEDIRGAKESVFLEFYWFDSDKVGRQVREALIEKAREGVRVCVTLDNLVTPFAPERFYEKIRRAGGEVRYARDFRKMSLGRSVGSVFSQRDHRKILVVDHCIAWTGGMNICNPAIYEWNDLEMRLTGPVAAAMGTLFARRWAQLGGELLSVPESEGEGPVVMQVIPGDADDTIADIYTQAVRQARKYIYIQTPYFVPPPSLTEAMGEAARRGVDVRMMLEKSDHGFMDELAKDYYAPLLADGVRVSVRQGLFDHSKTFVADDALVGCGTQNLDNRSFFINLENNVFLYDEALAREMAGRFLEIESSARIMKASDVSAKGLRRLYRRFLRSFSPLL